MRDFNFTMDVLVKAYFNGTLEHRDCTACAVGNICGGNPDWSRIFCTVNGDIQLFAPDDDDIYLGYIFLIKDKIAKQKALALIESTGYTIKELARVEFAFETAPKGETDDDWMFNGLMAVLEVLSDIHGIVSGKEIFEKQLVEIHSNK